MGRRDDWELISIQLPADLKRQLEELAAMDTMPMSTKLRLLIKEEYEREVESRKRQSPEQSGDAYNGTFGKS